MIPKCAAPRSAQPDCAQSSARSRGLPGSAQNSGSERGFRFVRANEMRIPRNQAAQCAIMRLYGTRAPPPPAAAVEGRNLHPWSPPEQSEGARPRPPSPRAHRRHRSERLREILARVRHGVRGGPAPLRRDLLPLRSPVPRSHGSAPRRPDRRHPARRRGQPDQPGPDVALDGGHHDGDQRLPEAPLRAPRPASLPGMRRGGAARYPGEHRGPSPRRGGRRAGGRALPGPGARRLSRGGGPTAPRAAGVHAGREGRRRGVGGTGGGAGRGGRGAAAGNGPGARVRRARPTGTDRARGHPGPPAHRRRRTGAARRSARGGARRRPRAGGGGDRGRPGHGPPVLFRPRMSALRHRLPRPGAQPVLLQLPDRRLRYLPGVRARDGNRLRPRHPRRAPGPARRGDQAAPDEDLPPLPALPPQAGGAGRRPGRRAVARPRARGAQLGHRGGRPAARRPLVRDARLLRLARAQELPDAHPGPPLTLPRLPPLHGMRRRPPQAGGPRLAAGRHPPLRHPRGLHPPARPVPRALRGLPPARPRRRSRLLPARRDPVPTALSRRCRPRLPHPRPPVAHPERRRGPAHQPHHRARDVARQHPVRARRTERGASSPRPRPDDRGAAPAARRGQHDPRGRARRTGHPGRGPGARPRAGSGGGRGRGRLRRVARGGWRAAGSPSPAPT